MRVTEKCIACGGNPTCYHGHVLAVERMALGNYEPTKIVCGFCEEHNEALKADQNGCYGQYNNETMGKVIWKQF